MKNLLDELLHERIIKDEEMDNVNAEKTTQDKARHVIDLVRKKGKKASSVMIAAIQRVDRNLSEKLQLDG